MYHKDQISVERDKTIENLYILTHNYNSPTKMSIKILKKFVDQLLDQKHKYFPKKKAEDSSVRRQLRDKSCSKQQ
jgi:hypothetical protein